MTVQRCDVIDFVAYDPDLGTVSLVMVEDRDWGQAGALLPDLQAKLNTYLSYIVSGRLWQDYPTVTGKPVQIELRCCDDPGQRELDFLRIVEAEHFRPEGIGVLWKRIGDKSLVKI